MATERKATQKAAPATATKAKAPKAKKPTSVPLSHGVGRRKSSVARVWLRKGSGKVVVNGKTHSAYFDTDLSRLEALSPLLVIPNVSHYDAYANVEGGGLHSQAGATKLGIARALVAFDEALRSPLRQHGFLTVDSRLKERKKYGQRGARRKFQFVKR
ncbi:MAG: 30S ribosomal protein S9 [Candidatus Babeliales bacterium]